MEVQVRDLISTRAGEDMKQFLASGLDVRSFIGLSQDPQVHFFNNLKTKYKISKALENFTIYEVKAKNEEELPQEKYHMTVFESKNNYDIYLKYVTSRAKTQA